MLNNMSLMKKLMTGFALVALVAGIIGAIGVTEIKKIDAADTKLYEKMTVPLGIVGDLGIAFQRMRCNLLELLVAESPERFNDQMKRAGERDKEIEELLGKYEPTILTEQGRKDFAALKEAYKQFDVQEKRYENLVEVHPKVHGRLHAGLEVCYLCGREGHWAQNCRYKTYWDGTRIEE
jgi:flagellar motility protein MotE (MotC chaperone)